MQPITGTIRGPFKIRTVTINVDFDPSGSLVNHGPNHNEQRVKRLAKLMGIMARDHHVAIFNLQDINSRYMHMELFRLTIMTQLLTVNPAWTATNPFGRHGDANNSLHLITFYNANILHLNSVVNHHFGQDARTVGDDLCPDEPIQFTSNAIFMDMSLVVPETTGEFHTGGTSVDNGAKFLNVSVHIPIRNCPQKVALAFMNKLLDYINAYPAIASYFVSVSGDLKGSLVKGYPMLDIMQNIGQPSATLDNGDYSYRSLGGKKRTTTFIGMVYDAASNVKLPVENVAAYQTFAKGDAAEIEALIDVRLQPTEWHLSRNQPWCRALESTVVDIDDLRIMGFDVHPLAIGSSDWGDFITDHLPLMTTIQYGTQ